MQIGICFVGFCTGLFFGVATAMIYRALALALRLMKGG